MTKHSNRRRVRGFWPVYNRPSSSTTDDIPPVPDSYATDILHRLTRYATDPIASDTRIQPLPVFSPSPQVPSHVVAMTSEATITFTQTGVQPPVYVVTSLSDPPWEPLEMSVEEEQTASANLVFTRRFSSVAEGSYQYKIRVGEGHWVVDETKETATDNHGNRNNVIHVKHVSPVKPPAEEKQPPKSFDNRKDSALDPVNLSQLPSVPVPFVVVEKVADKEQPEYGDVEPESLPADAAKRTADAEPDFEHEKAESPVEVHDVQTSDVPLLVVEKTDDKPAYGDDFGENATAAQRVAHDMRAADAAPDTLIISPESHTQTTMEDDDQAAPLFSHETLQTNIQSITPSMDTIDEESLHSSADQTSSSDVVNTPTESEELQEDNRFDQQLLSTHQDKEEGGNGELECGPLLSHENGLEDEDVSELDHGPLLSHEVGPNDDQDDVSDEEDEFDRAPLLPHETGFSGYKGSEITTDSGSLRSENLSEPQHSGSYSDDGRKNRTRTFGSDHAPTFSHEEGYDDEDDLLGSDYGSVPLLPHERPSGAASNAGSELSTDDAHYILHGRRASGHEAEGPQELFGGNRRPNVFRTRSNSSTLPHKLPQTDAEDENLNDPSLEKFPTSREQILERVATIGLQLPEDETIEDTLHSPQLSVFSQACSSVDLVPVKSYISLASVPEADDSDEEDNRDLESLPSPIVLGGKRSASNLTRDLHLSSSPDGGRFFELNAKKIRSPNDRTADSSEAESVSKNDGVKDRKNILKSLPESIATPTKILNPITPPLTPESKEQTTERENTATATEPQLRQRREQKDEPAQSTSILSEDSNAKGQINSTSSKGSDQRKGTFFQTFVGILFGTFGRFLTACLGDRKRASVLFLVLGAAVAAYYFLALES